jgi:probable phosphoglycerate mutase
MYLIRHGKTRFNTIGRAQGWCDSPLTAAGKERVRALGRGLKAAGLKFDAAYSSDMGRTIETMTDIMMEFQPENEIEYRRDERIREWCFGSMDGAFDSEAFGVLPRTSAFDHLGDPEQATYKDLANAIYEVDTAGWSENYEDLANRVHGGFMDILKQAEAAGHENIIVVSHGMTIGLFLWLVDNESRNNQILNASVSIVDFKAGKLSVDRHGDTSYIDRGLELPPNEIEKEKLNIKMIL